MSLITRYLVAITELLGLEMRGMGWMAEVVFEKADKIGRIEDIQYDWVNMAEQVWRSSQWVKILNEMAQESNVTLVGSEVEALRVFFFFFFFYLVVLFGVLTSSFPFGTKYRNFSRIIFDI